MALDEVRTSESDATIAVMLASVADGEMPASDLCFELLASDERFGLLDRPGHRGTEDGPVTASKPAGAPTPEQREARRQKKQKDAEERRRKMEASRKAAEQVRRARKADRSGATGSSASSSDRTPAPSA